MMRTRKIISPFFLLISFLILIYVFYRSEVIWGGDHDIDEENDTYSMVSNLSCPKCHCFVEVYYPNEETLKDYKKDETQ